MNHTDAGNGIRIGIIGAGPAGLMTALALEHYCAGQPLSITILDRNKSALDYPGVEYGIQARACHALERINQLEQALCRANPCSKITFYNARIGKHFRPVRSNPTYTRAVVRQEFLGDVEKLLHSTEVCRCRFVDKVTPSVDGSVIVEGKIEGSSGRFSECFDLLVAADGVHSIVRQSLFPETATTYDRGFSCIYMLIEGDATNAPSGFLERANSGTSELIMGHFSTLTMFPLGKGRLALGIGLDHHAKESLWARNNLSPDVEWKSIPARLKRAIAIQLASDSGDEMFVKALDLVPDWDSYKIYLWAMRDTDPLPRPYTDTGNLILIGDAAHAIMPTIGMGASLAIEDAEHLATLIADVIAKLDRIETFRTSARQKVFPAFARSRYPVWRELVSRSRVAAERNFIGVGRRRRFAIGSQIPNNVLSRIVSSVEWLLEKVDIIRRSSGAL